MIVQACKLKVLVALIDMKVPIACHFLMSKIKSKYVFYLDLFLPLSGGVGWVGKLVGKLCS